MLNHSRFCWRTTARCVTLSSKSPKLVDRSTELERTQPDQNLAGAVSDRRARLPVSFSGRSGRLSEIKTDSTISSMHDLALGCPPAPPPRAYQRPTMNPEF